MTKTTSLNAIFMLAIVFAAVFWGGAAKSLVAQGLEEPAPTPIEEEAPEAIPDANANNMANMTGMRMGMELFKILGMNGLLYGKYHLHGEEEGHSEGGGHDHGALEEGLGIQEVEFSILTDIDAFLRAGIFLAYHGDEWEFEDFYLEAVDLVKNLNLKLGRFFPVFGKYNHVHTHALPFVNRSLHHRTLLGGEGLIDFGAELKYLFPVPFFLEMNLAWIQARNEALFLFDGGKEEALSSGATPFHIRVLFDLSDDMTLEWGYSQVIGANNFSVIKPSEGLYRNFEGVSTTQLHGLDLTLKWLDNVRNASGLTLNIEAAMRTVNKNTYKDAEVEELLGGGHALVQYKFLKRFHAQYRYAVDGLFSDHDDDLRQQHSQLLAFVPSEFSVFRLQYDLTQHDDELSGELIGQLNFTIGAHPAHSY